MSFFYLGTCTYLICGAARRSGVPTAVTITASAVAAAASIGVGLDAPSVGLVSVALIVAASSLDVRGATFGARPLKALGDMSYSLYLIHVPLQIATLTAVDLVAPGYRDFADAWWLLPVYVATCCLAASIIHRRLELPAGRAIRAFASPPPHAPPPPSTSR